MLEYIGYVLKISTERFNKVVNVCESCIKVKIKTEPSCCLSRASLPSALFIIKLVGEDAFEGAVSTRSMELELFEEVIDILDIFAVTGEGFHQRVWVGGNYAVGVGFVRLTESDAFCRFEEVYQHLMCAYCIQ